jgi:DNA-binding NarL/FixJ family response regulator
LHSRPLIHIPLHETGQNWREEHVGWAIEPRERTTLAIQPVLPGRAQRVSDETASEVLRRHVKGQPDTRIARELGLSRTTVRRVRERVLAGMAVLLPVEEERARAIAIYREVQRVAWRRSRRPYGGAVHR